MIAGLSSLILLQFRIAVVEQAKSSSAERENAARSNFNAPRGEPNQAEVERSAEQGEENQRKTNEASIDHNARDCHHENKQQSHPSERPRCISKLLCEHVIGRVVTVMHEAKLVAARGCVQTERSSRIELFRNNRDSARHHGFEPHANIASAADREQIADLEIEKRTFKSLSCFAHPKFALTFLVGREEVTGAVGATAPRRDAANEAEIVLVHSERVAECAEFARIEHERGEELHTLNQIAVERVAFAQ